MRINRCAIAISVAALLTVVSGPSFAASGDDQAPTTVKRHHVKKHHTQTYPDTYGQQFYGQRPYGEQRPNVPPGTFPNDCATEGSGGRIDYGACGGGGPR